MVFPCSGDIGSTIVGQCLIAAGDKCRPTTVTLWTRCQAKIGTTSPHGLKKGLTSVTIVVKRKKFL